MRTNVNLVPPCFMPGGLACTVWAAEDGAGLEVYISELVPPALREAWVKTATAADPGELRVLHLIN